MIFLFCIYKMDFLIKIFCSLFFFNYITTQDFVEFTFDAIPLGHSGLLVTWKPNITTQIEVTLQRGDYYFTFQNFIIGETNNENYKSDDNQNRGSAEQNNKNSESNESKIDSTLGQHKIHSLRENTRYNVTIKQYSGTSLKEYFIEMKTNLKSKKIPAKPDFDFMYKGSGFIGGVRWYPCGRERICYDQESGTHFGVTIKEPYNTRKLSEVKKEEFFTDYLEVIFWSGILYEVVVYSINGDCKTDSDSREIMLKPTFSPVQYVNIISLPDLSALISWKPPKQSTQKSLPSYLFYYFNLSESHADLLDQIIIRKDLTDSDRKRFRYKFDQESKLGQIRIFDLKPEVTYAYIIIPRNREGLGFQYRTKQKFQVHNQDLPIAKPDFNYEFERTNPNKCQFYFQWLPCGQSFNCENTKPGSNYTFDFEPEPVGKHYLNDLGYYSGILQTDRVYNVTVKSSIGNNFSESVTKIFENCDEIREKTPLGERN